MAENKSGMKIKCLRSNNRGEFNSNNFNQLCEGHGIKRQFSDATTPRQIWVVETINQQFGIIQEPIARKKVLR